MKVEYHEAPVPYIIFDDFYDDEACIEIWEELEWLTARRVLKPPARTGSATASDGEILKQNRAVFLYEYFASNISRSKILKHSRRLFSDDVKAALIGSGNWYFTEGFPVTNMDTALVSYYETSDHYKPHHDCAHFTALTWFFREPKAFDGGDFLFPHFDKKIEVRSNRCVVFPSLVTHQVTPVEMHTDTPRYHGRYTISQFVTATGANKVTSM